MIRRSLIARPIGVVLALTVSAACAGGDPGGAGDGTVAASTAAAAGPTSTVAPPVHPAPDGPGSLVDATDELGLLDALTGIRGHAVATADVNADGWPDLFVGTFADREPATYRERGADGPAPDRVLLGSPDGFTVDPSFEGRLGRSAGAVFADLDNDGDPDLVVSRNVREGERADAPSEVYRNEAGTLEPWLVLDEDRGGRAVRTIDVDADGWLDLLLIEDRWSGASSALLRNEQGTGFRDVTADVGFPDDVAGLGAAVGDLDGDGVDDIVVGGSNRWFLGTGDGFVEGEGSPLPWATHGDEDDPAHVVLADVDGDGRLDVLLGQHFNSTVDSGRPEPVRLYLNRDDGSGRPRFEDATDQAGLPPLATKSPQLVLLDLDGDQLAEIVTTASYPDEAGERQPLVIEALDDGPHYRAGGTGTGAEVGPHYWIDAVTLDANRDGRDDVFMVEWEPALGARLFLNLPQ